MKQKYTSFIAAVLAVLLLTACGGGAAEEVHACSSVCGDCGLCTDSACSKAECAEKCAGHHVCGSVCPDCGGCLKEDCREAVCQRKCPGHHSCDRICPECGMCLDPVCTEAVCGEKCPGHNAACNFYDSGFITAEAVSIDTGTLVLDIGPGIWVPGQTRDAAAAVVQTMESVSGLSFAGDGISANHFSDGKVHASFSRDMLYSGEDWYQGLDTSEVGSAWAGAWGHAELSPGDLFISGQAALVHELGHVLSYRQTEWTWCQLLSEGFAEYTSYLTACALEETDPRLGYYVGDPNQNLMDMMIFDYGQLYAHPLEYWFENTLEASANANYTIGFRFMAYLRDTYGDYSSWILKAEELYSFQTCSEGSDQISVQWQLEALKATYGEDVLDNFYPWLRANQKAFEPASQGRRRDLTEVDMLNLYPFCMANGSPAALENFTYRDLYINLESAKAYLRDYKGIDISGLELSVSAPAEMEVYDAEGNCTGTVCRGSMPAGDISCIRLTGSGALEYLKLTGYEGSE